MAKREGHPCPVCGEASTVWDGDYGDKWRVDCDTCGNYEITGTALPRLTRAKTDGFPPLLLSHRIRRMQERDARPLIGSDGIASLTERRNAPLPSEQAGNLIRWLGAARAQDPFGEEARTYVQMAAIVGSPQTSSVSRLVKELASGGLVEDLSTMGRCSLRLTLRGWDFYGELLRAHSEGPIAFMAMPFGDDDLDRIYAEFFKPAVAETGFELRRVDERPKAGLIDDRLRVEIRRCRFLIADLTHENRGAYWEAGYAEGLGKPVIYTCHQEHFDKSQTHFDTNHHLTVKWHPDRLPAAASDLKATIRATLPAEARMADD